MSRRYWNGSSYQSTNPNYYAHERLNYQEMQEGRHPGKTVYICPQWIMMKRGDRIVCKGPEARHRMENLLEQGYYCDRHIPGHNADKRHVRWTGAYWVEV